MTANTGLSVTKFDTTALDLYIAIKTADTAHLSRCNKATQKVSVLSFYKYTRPPVNPGCDTIVMGSIGTSFHRILTF